MTLGIRPETVCGAVQESGDRGRENRRRIKVLRMFPKSKRTKSFSVTQYLKEFCKEEGNN